MIVRENLTINGKEFIKTFSNAGYMIERDGIRYDEAIDPAELNRQYTETDELLQYEDMTETEEKAEAYDILMGVKE